MQNVCATLFVIPRNVKTKRFEIRWQIDEDIVERDDEDTLEIN